MPRGTLLPQTAPRAACKASGLLHILRAPWEVSMAKHLCETLTLPSG